MPEYVPYEERKRRAHDDERRRAGGRASAQQAAVAQVNSLLAALGGLKTNCFLELLEPMPHRYRGDKPVVSDHGLSIRDQRGRYRMNAPCLIDEVVAAYRLPRAMHGPPGKDGHVMVLDAFVTQDGRCWQFGAGTPDDAIYQPLKANGYSVESNSVDNLERIISALRRIHAA